MKKLTLVVALITLTTVSFAAKINVNSIEVSVVSDSTNGVYNVSYKATTKGKVKISILNNDRKEIFMETLTVGSFVRPYNFSTLGEGDYIIVLEDKNGKSEEKISYRKDKVSSFIKVNKIGGNKYMFRAVSTGKDKLTVKIMSKNNVVLYEETVSVDGTSAFVYDLNKIEQVPTFEITNSVGTVTTILF